MPIIISLEYALSQHMKAIVVTQWIDEHIQILHAEEYQKLDYKEMLNLVSKLIKKFNINKI
jgi:Leu/Phe-tRNA-protein transferase